MESLLGKVKLDRRTAHDKTRASFGVEDIDELLCSLVVDLEHRLAGSVGAQNRRHFLQRDALVQGAIMVLNRKVCVNVRFEAEVVERRTRRKSRVNQLVLADDRRAES